MKNIHSKNLTQLHQILQFTAEGFCDAVNLIAELPPILHDDALSSCKRWLTMLTSDFAILEKEMRGVIQNGTK